MMLDCIARECNAAIKERKRSSGCHKHPLFAWIKGAPKIRGKSRIELVIDNQARWPWYTLNAAGHDFKERLTAKRKLSFVQKDLLESYIECRFPGRYNWFGGNVPDSYLLPKNKRQQVQIAANATSDFVRACLEKNNLEPYKNMPLRLILSPEFCVLINLKFMEFYL